jgi:hypothetical protein
MIRRRPNSAANWLRPGVSIIAGMWLAVRLQKPFWIYAPIFGFAVLGAIHIVWAVIITIAFYFEWRKNR